MWNDVRAYFSHLKSWDWRRWERECSRLYSWRQSPPSLRNRPSQPHYICLPMLLLQLKYSKPFFKVLYTRYIVDYATGMNKYLINFLQLFDRQNFLKLHARLHWCFVQGVPGFSIHTNIQEAKVHKPSDVNHIHNPHFQSGFISPLLQNHRSKWEPRRKKTAGSKGLFSRTESFFMARKRYVKITARMSF